MIRNCLYCWEEFEAKNQRKVYCCSKHKAAFFEDKYRTIIKICKFCWKEFKTRRNKAEFCSISCSRRFNEWSRKKAFEKTCLKKYGVDNISKLDSIKDKKKQSCIKKYWVDNVMKIWNNKIKMVNTTKKNLLSKYWVEWITQLDWVQGKVKQAMLDKYWVEYWFMLWDNTRCSWYNKQTWKRLQFVTNQEVEYEFHLWDYFYDIKCWKFLFEIDPIRTHNSSRSFFENRKPLDKYYHQKKSLFAEKNWYHCIHLFEWDNNETVKEWIKWLIWKRKRLYHWEIRKVNWKDAEVFYDNNHLQGKCSATVHYWLYVKDKLINCMSFTCFKWEWQLVRFASLKWYRIAHWAEKLFNAFVKEYDPDYIVSFSDITKHSWWLYNALGFELDRINAPSYRRADVNKKNVYWRRDCQKQRMHTLEWFDPNYKYLEHKDDPFWKQTEVELMESHWYVRVYDSGMRKHIWYKKKD